MIADAYEAQDGQARNVAITVEESMVSVEIGASTVSLRRVDGKGERPGVPIGTRDETELELSVNGVSMPLSLGPGRILRRSYRVKFAYNGERYIFAPVTDDESSVHRGHIELARYFVDENDRVEFFQDGDDSPTPTESAAGFALAAAFGCGAMHGFGALVEVAVNGAGQ